MTKAKHFAVADTETTGLGSRAIVFDFAYSVVTRKETVLTRSFLVREIITNPKIMLRAVDDENWRQSFGGKLFSHYIPELDKGGLRIYPWHEIIRTFHDDMRTHNVKVFSAYNLNFDAKALQRTQEIIAGKDKILPFKMDLLDLWKFACVTVLNTKLYHDVARRMGQDTGFVTPADNVRTTAEKTYAFLTGDLSFIEAHTAREDVEIETEILQRLLAKKTRIPYNEVEPHAWRLAQAFKTRGLPQRFDADLFDTSQ